MQSQKNAFSAQPPLSPLHSAPRKGGAARPLPPLPGSTAAASGGAGCGASPEEGDELAQLCALAERLCARGYAANVASALEAARGAAPSSAQLSRKCVGVPHNTFFET